MAGDPFGEGENFPQPPAPRETPRAEPSFKTRLLERSARDQQARLEWLKDQSDAALGEKVQQIDRENTDWLRTWLDDGHGWPRISEIGTDGARAAFLIVQHSPDKAFQRRCLDMMTPLVKQQEVQAVDWAYLLDRVRLAEGQKQVFGSQVTMGPDGKLQIAPLEDPEHVDARRAELGMPPLDEYLKLVEDMYQERP